MEANKPEDEAGKLIWWLGGISAVAVVAVVLTAFLHFFVGADIWFIEAKNTTTAVYWGQLGDFVGGMLNPVLSFFALLAVLISLRSQSAELRAARAEARAAQNVLEQQTKIFREQSKLVERQNFESVFFGVLQLYLKGLESLTYFTGSREVKGRDAFVTATKRYRLERVMQGHGSDLTGADLIIWHAQNVFWADQRDAFSSHYQMLKELLLYVDSFGSPVVSKALDVWRSAISSILDSQLKDDAAAKTVYSQIVKATFSPSEVHLLALYCLTKDGEDICPLVKKFKILEGFAIDGNNESAEAALRRAGAIS